MPPPFTPLWARLRPAEGAAPHAWTSWPGPVIAAQTVPHEGRTVYASISFTTPHRLNVLEAVTGQRLAPPMVCHAGQDTFALVAGPTVLVGAGTNDLIEPLRQVRHRYSEDSSADIRLVASVTGSAEPLLVTAHPFQGIKLWDAASQACLADVRLAALGSPDRLCAGLLRGKPHAVVSDGAQLCTYEADSGHVVARWTSLNSDIVRMTWAQGVVGSPDAVVTADSRSRLQAWDPRTGEPLGEAQPLPGRPLHLSAALVEVGGTSLPLVACAYGDGVHLLRTDSGDTLLDLSVSAWTRTAHLTTDGLLLLGTLAGPVALRLDTDRLASGSEEHAELDLTGFSTPEKSDEDAAPDTSGQPSHTDLVKLWGTDQVIVLPDSHLSGNTTAPNREVLCDVSLPLAPFPGLTLDQDLATDGLAPLEEVGVGPVDPDDPDARPVPEGLDGYHWLGTWHDDDLVLSPTGAVEVVGAETGYEEAQPVNSSLAAFVTFTYEFALAALQQEPEYGGDAQEVRAERLEQRLRAIDEIAFASDSSEHWADALSDLEAGM
ncbi:SUKH-4 family immunity protein [Streptomyces sp. NPDC050636]|uniref:SUKH-4 family immunity protein n=1 Tax=Streptomyces sp. NPDC050636 TaxID=3154510 RepID=UPI003415E227